MAKLTEDEIDDLQYFARMGDIEEFNALKDELCKREKVNVVGLLDVAKDELSGNGVLHMAAANGHHGTLDGPSPYPQIVLLLRRILANCEVRTSSRHLQRTLEPLTSKPRYARYYQCTERSWKYCVTLGGTEWTFGRCEGADRAGMRSHDHKRQGP